MVRKTSDEEARIIQEHQAQAAIRRLNRRLAQISNKPDTDGYYHFLMACRDDVVSPPVFFRRVVAA